ncbi:MAG: glycosyltransferase family 4 protein [Burkholderiales bacterium]
MRLLVIHQNFPGQFKHLVQAWQHCPGWDVRAIGRDTAPGLPGFANLIRYQPARGGRPDQHPYLRTMENAVLHGQAVARVLLKLKQQGWRPDTILAHPGWGETLYAKDVFPDARLVHYCEWYYGAEGAAGESDLGFDPEFPATFDDRARIRTWNALHTLNLEHCDQGVTPTRWQWQQHPLAYRDKIAVIHEGIDTDRLGPDPAAWIKTPSGNVLKAGDPVITYVARNLEPYRGFHIFMRALEKIQQQHPTCHAVIVGGDDVSYGRRPPEAKTWREHMLREVTFDPARTHFMGKLPYADYARVLQVSAAHVYLTYPFVLSWSLLEAMACGCQVIASNTAPVREAMEHNRNGWLLRFDDVDAIAHAGAQALARRADLLRQNAMHTSIRYGTDKGIAAYTRLLQDRLRPPSAGAAIRRQNIEDITGATSP